MKKLCRSFAAMSNAAFILLKDCLLVACAMLFGAFMLLVHTPTPESLALWKSVEELISNPAGILLLGALGSVLLEERSRR